MKRATKNVFSGVAGALLVLAILVAGNALLASVRIRADLTDEKLYTLSGGTVEAFRSLDRPVVLKFYFSRSNPDVPVPLKNFAQRTEDFLREIESRSGGKIALEVLDPRPDSEIEEWAQRYGLMPQSLGGIGMPPDLYLGLVAVSGTKEAAIPLLAPALEPQLEYLVARLVQETTRDRRPRLAVLSGLPAVGRPSFGPGGGASDWLFVSELKAQYEVEPLDKEADAIPEGTDMLVVIHPKELGETTLYAIDQYLLKGGRMLAFVDPLCVSDEDFGSGYGGDPVSSDLNRLTKAWGIQVDATKVVSDPAAATPINVGAGQAEILGTWLTLRGEQNMEKTELSTAPLDNMMMPFAGAIAGNPAEVLQMVTLLRSSEESAMLDAFMVQQAPGKGANAGEPAPGSALAVRITGRFPTAFPDGPPETERGNADNNAETAGNHLTNAQADGVVVLVSDADMLADRFLAQTLRFFGQTVHQPVNDNLNFALNLAEQLSGNSALVELRSRGRFDRPFKRVLAMEQAAQARWREEEKKLQDKLAETQRRIGELQAAKSDDQQLVLSSAQRAEIERFRQERFETQRQLTEVRRNLRSNIERLGLGLKLINMAAVPMLVAVFGVVYGMKRRNRAAT